LRPQAFTLVELLLALAVLVVVMSMAFSTSIQGLQLNQSNEAISAAQNKARRVLEVLSQDLRTAAFAIITHSPFNSNTTAISFAQVAGGAGYTVTAVAGNTLTITSNSTTLSSEVPVGSRLVVVDGNGNTVLTRTTGLPVSSGLNTYTITTTCAVLPVSATSQTLASVVNLMGYSYDTSNQKLVYREQGDAASTDVAFDVSNFRIDYVYQRRANGAVSEERNPSGYLVSGQVRPYFTSGGAEFALRRVQFTLGVQVPLRGRNVERTYTGQVDMINTLYYQVKAVNLCNP
jgi:prepilin-type N-terminal cleavage/methylation domain-containing protein